jgi:hypothetical protein
MTVVTHVLDHVLGPLSDSLSAQEVERLSSIPADASMEARMDELAAKANEGSLSPEEHSEYQLYIETSEFVATLLAKARGRLKNAA